MSPSASGSCEPDIAFRNGFRCRDIRRQRIASHISCNEPNQGKGIASGGFAQDPIYSGLAAEVGDKSLRFRFVVECEFSPVLIELSAQAGQERLEFRIGLQPAQVGIGPKYARIGQPHLSTAP